MVCFGCLDLTNFLSGRTKEAQSTVFEMLERNLGDKLRLTLSNMELSSNSDPSISGFSIAKLFYRPIQGYLFLYYYFMIFLAHLALQCISYNSGLKILIGMFILL